MKYRRTANQWGKREQVATDIKSVLKCDNFSCNIISAIHHVWREKKRMSYTADFKLKMIKVAEETTNLEVGRKFGVEERMEKGDITGYCT